VAFTRAASEVVTGTAVAAAILCVIATAVAYVTLPAFIGDAGAEVVSETRSMMVALAPLGVFGALIGVLGAVLAAWGNFMPAAAVMGLDPLVRTILVVVFGARWGADVLVVGNLVGSGLAVIVLWVVARRKGLRLRPVFGARSRVVRDVLALSAPLLVGQSVLQVNPIIDRTMGASLGAGSVTELELGLRLFAFPMTMLTSTMIGPLTATWAARKAADGWPALRRSLNDATAGLIALVPPLMVAGVLLRDPAMRLVYGGGAYSDASLHVTATVFGYFLLGLPVQLLVVLVATLFVVNGDGIFPMKVAFANVLLNIGLNLLLRPELGVGGIALSTTLTFVVLCSAYVVVAQRRWSCFSAGTLRQPLVRAVVSIVLGTAAGEAVQSAIDFGTGRGGDALEVLVVSACVLAVHAAVLLVGRGGSPTASFRALLPARGRLGA
jgi:putative peptidoglycan lipid II flippase